MFMLILILEHVVLMIAKCLVAVFGRLLYLVWSVCVAPLLRLECALYETCLDLHVVSSCRVEYLF